MIHANSTHSYHTLKLTQRQKEVINALDVLGQATDTQIADYLGYTVNRVTGRITELRDSGVIVECDTVRGEFGKPVRVCRVKNTKENLF